MYFGWDGDVERWPVWETLSNGWTSLYFDLNKHIRVMFVLLLLKTFYLTLFWAKNKEQMDKYR